jgi:predicted  nucleic acid-binding Zn-ribbon protein
MPFKFPCAYCGTVYTDKRESIFNGMLLKCLKCGKLTQVFLAREDEDREKVIKGQTY